MTEQILAEQLQTHPLKVTDVISYLKQNGWETVTHPNPRLLVFQDATDDAGNVIQLVLPSQNTFEDSDRLLIKAINLVAAIAEKSPQEIINSITQTATNSTLNT
jgi:hypothetical protein